MASSFEFIQSILHNNQEVPADSILSQSLLQNADVRVILFNFSPGQELSEHTAAKPALLHFLDGEAEVILGEETRQAGPGTFVHMEAHLPHSILAKTAVTMLLILLNEGK